MGEVSNCSSEKHIPEDVIFHILSFLAADELYNVMRRVCKDWYNIINSPEFIHAHHQKSSEGLLIQPRVLKPNEPIHFAEIKNNCDVQIRELRYHHPYRIDFSCNGLGLTQYFEDFKLRCIMNPITNKMVTTLPPFSEYIAYDTNSALVYAHSIKSYKVVSLGHYNEGDFNELLVCGIFTVGSDMAWRFIDTRHILDHCRGRFIDTRHILDHCHPYIFDVKPLFVGGYLYWFPYRGRSEFLLALDVENEIMQQLPLPEVCLYERRGSCNIMVKGSSLALMVEKMSLVWEVWVLTDLNTSEWTRLYNIDLTEHRDRVVDEVSPLTTLKNGEVVIFRILDRQRCLRDLTLSRTYFVYNIKAREMNSFRLSEEEIDLSFEFVHVNSLIRLKI